MSLRRRAAVGADDLKGVAVQVHGMPHHGGVGKRERGALALPNGEGVGVGEWAPVDLQS